MTRLSCGGGETPPTARRKAIPRKYVIGPPEIE
jgi:hypothetical protein